MPRSVFLGRVVADGEPLWTDEDRGWALALLEEEADTCRGCGQPLSETTGVGPDGRPAHAYTVRAPHRCEACVLLYAQMNSYRDDQTVRTPEALHFGVTRIR